MRRIAFTTLGLLALWLITACTPAGPAVPTAAPLTATLTMTPVLSATPAPVTPTATLTPAPTHTPSQTPSPTPDVYLEYTVDYLASRAYGGGAIEIVDLLAENSWFTRYLVRYNSDDLWIYGFLNVPVAGGPIGDGPFPVVIALHGYIEPEIYAMLDYTTGYADAITRAGYIVFHPNLRGYAPSGDGDNLFRVGMAIDVLNLIALIRSDAGQIAELEDALRDRIGLWGHSMGGGIATRVLTVSQDVAAAVLYASMSGDERQNYEAINFWSGGVDGLEELAVPDVEFSRISPENYFDRITASVSIHHGRADQLVPLLWSVQTCGQMAQLRIDVRCAFYDQMPHTFVGDGDADFTANMIDFFNRVLKSR